MVDEVEQFVFHPKPGGMVDRHRQERARREAAEAEAQNVSERVEEQSYKAVKVAPESPEVVACNSVNVPAGGTAQVLPGSPYRYRVTLIASATVILGKDSSQALGGSGFPLPANVPLVLVTRSQLWAFATGAATVGVIAELYAPESV
jgi:hypothetical protein